MRILLISDTHGRLIDRISAYGEEWKADICIHAGDFGFYDTTSVEAMSQRELYLLVKHSALPDDEKAALLGGNAQNWKEAIIQKRLLGLLSNRGLEVRIHDTQQRKSRRQRSVCGSEDHEESHE